MKREPLFGGVCLRARVRVSIDSGKLVKDGIIMCASVLLHYNIYDTMYRFERSTDRRVVFFNASFFLLSTFAPSVARVYNIILCLKTLLRLHKYVKCISIQYICMYIGIRAWGIYDVYCTADKECDRPFNGRWRPLAAVEHIYIHT